MAYYVIGEGNNFYEGMTKEQILAAITQAVESHTISDVDTGFVTTVKEQNRNTPLALWVGTEAEYNAIQDKDYNTLYIKTDDSTLEAIEEALQSQQEELDTHQSTLDRYNTRITRLEEADMYRSGKIIHYDFFTFSGYITEQNKRITFTVKTDKNMYYVTSINGIHLSANIRHSGGGYVTSEASPAYDPYGYNFVNNATVTATKVDDYTVRIDIENDSGFGGTAPTNSPVSICTTDFQFHLVVG